MCLILFAYQVHPDYPLIMAANRDEFYGRATAHAAFWGNGPHVLAGRDLEKGGTWMGVTRNGRFAAITNYRAPGQNRVNMKSRGFLVSDYLTGTEEPKVYLQAVQQEREAYNGFNLLVGDTKSLYYYSPILDEIQKVPPGIHGLSNAVLDTPWPKVRKGAERLAQALTREMIDEATLLSVLSDSEEAPEEELPETGVGKEWEKLLSPLFIQSDTYGTRSSTVLTINRDRDVIFTEKFLLPDLKEWKQSHFTFAVEEKQQ
ncbi:NRDE family protein [Priestia abyssalis]|uniref:NRDE family protein n=1 Tax=Priestia abyssalis TaxID=1221450 RepID=UPI0009949004|nr:NRDE family protein [Priestia abyssalis]